MDTLRSVSAHSHKQRRYRYEPLQQLHDIRILQLHPGSRESPIEFNLLTIDLDDIDNYQPYEAISYAWGEVTESMTVICEGASLQITTSLFEALRILRPNKGHNSRTLWADHICINQDNHRERNHQVQLMRMIYTKAAKVLIWLGHDDVETVATGMNLVCRIAGRHLQTHEPMKPKTNNGNLQTPSGPQIRWRATTAGRTVDMIPTDFEFEAHELHGLHPLFGRGWFTRTWVLQEIALASSALAFWGHGEIDFMLIGLTALHIFEYGNLEFIQYDPYYRSKEDWGMLRYWTDAWDEVNLIEVLVVTRSLLTTDPRDKVFGLLGLTASDSDPEGSTYIDPDYSLTTAEVYLAVARKALLEQKDVNLLAAVHHGDHIPTGWTSWVPDWRMVPASYLHKPWRNTSNGTNPVIEAPRCPDCAQPDSSQTISVGGLVADIVHERIDLDFNVKSWLQMDLLRRLHAAVKELEDNFGEETLASTLTGGCKLDGSRIEDITAHVAEYRAFVNWDMERYVVGSSTVRAPSKKIDPTVASAYRFYASSGPTIVRRRLFVTKSGILGLGPLAMEAGDVVAVLFGGTVPFILRPRGDGQHCNLVGECYVHAIMGGQVVENWQKRVEPATEFHLY